MIPALLLALATATGAERPNVVLILADDLGYGDVQALNPESRIPTPHLDRLASEGMTFTDAHSPSAVCTPTRYGLLTGRYCWRSSLKSGVLGGYSPPLLEADRPTLGTLMQAGGHRTAAVGKWHLGMALPLRTPDADIRRWEGDPGIDFAGVITDGPTHHGFDHYFGVTASLDMAPYVYVRDDRFAELPNAQQQARPFPAFVRQGPRSPDFRLENVLDDLAREAVVFLERSVADQEPFFLYLALTAPHKPTLPHDHFRNTTGLGDYGDFVHQTDWTIGRVLRALDELEVAEDTLVVCTSDNGSYMYRRAEDAEDHLGNPANQGYRASHHRANGPWRGTKADVYEGGHRVPFFVRWPGRVEAGAACAETICHVDVFATLAEVTGASAGPGAAEDSHSLLPLLRQEPGARRPAPVVHHSGNGTFALRDGPWKLVFSSGSGGREAPKGKPFDGGLRLFHLAEDPAESRDVAAEHPEVVQRMSAALAEIRGG